MNLRKASCLQEGENGGVLGCFSVDSEQAVEIVLSPGRENYTVNGVIWTGGFTPESQGGRMLCRYDSALPNWVYLTRKCCRS